LILITLFMLNFEIVAPNKDEYYIGTYCNGYMIDVIPRQKSALCGDYLHEIVVVFE